MSIAVSGSTKYDTSAIWTPISILLFGNILACNASSISLQPSGSTEHTNSSLKSTHFLYSSYGIYHFSPSFGKQL